MTTVMDISLVSQREVLSNILAVESVSNHEMKYVFYLYCGL